MKAVSLFAGAGGLDEGVRRAGFDVVLANELDPLFCASHKRNFPDVPMFTGSVASLSSDLAGTIAPAAVNESVDLLVGGPPCPPFSKSRFYLQDKPRGLDDPNGFETVEGYLSVLAWLRPKAFLMENVAGMAYNVHASALGRVMSVASELGYEVSWKVLNAADFGVPQIRQRFFAVGMLRDSFRWPSPTHSVDGDGGRPRWVTAGAAINDLDVGDNADLPGHFAGGKHHDLLCQVPPGDNYLFFTEKRGHSSPQFEWRSRYWSFLLKLSPDLPSWTIQARRSNNMGPFHWRNRILTIAEIKRLQTFPDSWSFEGTIEQQWRQVGNAVPPVLAHQLAQAIADQLR